MCCFGMVTPDGLMWPGQAWFILLSCSTALEMLLTFSGLLKKTCVTCVWKSPRGRKYSTVYLLSRGQCSLKSWLFPYPLITLQCLSHNRRHVSTFYLHPLRKNPLDVFTSYRRYICRRKYLAVLQMFTVW